VQIAVNAYRWGWTFRYLHGPTINGTLNAPPEMVLPLGQTAEIAVSSSDGHPLVLDPGHALQARRYPRPGELLRPHAVQSRGCSWGAAASSAGLGHATMAFRVRIVSPAEYQRWLADEAKQ